MNRLPNASSAIIDDVKITAYLLSDTHPVGRLKAAFFHKFGFRRSQWRLLRNALFIHAQSAELISMTETEFGCKFVMEGPLIALDGRAPYIRTIWFLSPGETAPRLVTAYPTHGEKP
ncbi:MAG: DUF6883 domain-containing protein [Rhodospirillaceae bacterium]